MKSPVLVLCNVISETPQWHVIIYGHNNKKVASVGTK
jgi:hypothetical protein